MFIRLANSKNNALLNDPTKSGRLNVLPNTLSDRRNVNISKEDCAKLKLKDNLQNKLTPAQAFS